MISHKIYSKYSIVILICVMGILSPGCEDVITLDLVDVLPQIVIQGSITDEDGPYIVNISKSTDYFNPEANEKVENAIVIISDNKGNSENLVENEPGIYTTTNFETAYTKNYNIEVRPENKVYNASTTLVTPLVLDSISYKLENIFDEDFYEINGYFQDNTEKQDYAIIDVKQNGNILENPVLYEDRLTNGNYINEVFLDLEAANLEEGINTIEIIVRTIDADAYEYYKSLLGVLAINSESSPFSPTTPANPKSNLSNNALGYFGAYSISRKTIEIIK